MSRETLGIGVTAAYASPPPLAESRDICVMPAHLRIHAQNAISALPHTEAEIRFLTTDEFWIEPTHL
jgi:hypothetical protein